MRNKKSKSWISKIRGSKNEGENDKENEKDKEKDKEKDIEEDEEEEDLNQASLKNFPSSLEYLKNENNLHWEDFNSFDLYRIITDMSPKDGNFQVGEEKISNFCKFVKDNYAELMPSGNKVNYKFNKLQNCIASPNRDIFCLIRENEMNLILFYLEEEEKIELEGHFHKLIAHQISPNGDILISASEDENVKIWDIKRKEAIHSFYLKSANCNSICISDNNQYFAISTDNEKLFIYENEPPNYNLINSIDIEFQTKKFIHFL